MKRAFGKFRKIKSIENGFKVTSKYLGKGYWFTCDCNGDVSRPPILYLHEKHGIQREPSKNNVPHAEDCDFAKYPDQQRDVVTSYRSPNPTKRPRRLVPPFLRNKTNDEPMAKDVSTARKRPGLARLLVELLETCELQHLDAKSLENNRGRLLRQIDLIEKAAESVFLDTGRQMSDWMATSFRDYMDLRANLDKEREDWANGRPHGIYIDAFDRIDGNILYRDEEKNTPNIHVDGHLYIYGGYKEKRNPYLAICIVAKPTTNEKPRVIRAYAHPCLSKTNFALVDSALEKETLEQIILCKEYLSGFGVDVSILKPLSDMGPQSPVERPVCIPDFVLGAIGGPVRSATVVVETMGYQTKSYRNRKRDMRKWFHMVRSVRGSITPIVKHDREGEANKAKIREIDSKFWTRLRNELSDARGSSKRHATIVDTDV